MSIGICLGDCVTVKVIYAWIGGSSLEKSLYESFPDEQLYPLVVCNIAIENCHRNS